MNLWLKAQGTYSVTQINNLPTVTYAVQIVVSWLGTTLAAVYPSWVIYSITIACCLFSTLCMIIWKIPTGLKYVATPYSASGLADIVKVLRVVSLRCSRLSQSNPLLNREHYRQE